MPTPKNLIAHLSNGLVPADRAAFREAAETAIHRTVTAIWRTYFRPPPEDRSTTWVIGKKRPSKLITEPPRDGHVRRRRRVIA
jgi:hypothetical protein